MGCVGRVQCIGTDAVYTSRSCEVLNCVEGGDVRHGCGVFLDRSVVALTCWASSCHTHFSVNGEGSDKHEV